MKLTRKAVRRVLIALVAIAAGAALFEPAVFFLFRRAYPLFFESDLITQPNPHYGLELQPNLKNARMVAAARPHGVQGARDQVYRDEVKRRITFLVSTNAHGFRGPYYPIERTLGSFRLVCIGDSITLGWGVSEEESYCGQLRALLTEALPQREVEVINAGILGFPLQNVPALIEHKIAAFRPDVLYVMKLGDLHSPDPVGGYREALRRVHRAAQAAGARLILAAPPVSSFDLRPESRQFGPILQQVGRELGVPAIDFGPVFAAAGRGRGLKLAQVGDQQQLIRYRDGQPEVVLTAPNVPGDRARVAPQVYEYLDETTETEALFFDDGHPDVEGNGIIARAIVEALSLR